MAEEDVSVNVHLLGFGHRSALVAAFTGVDAVLIL